MYSTHFDLFIELYLRRPRRPGRFDVHKYITQHMYMYVYDTYTTTHVKLRALTHVTITTHTHTHTHTHTPARTSMHMRWWPWTCWQTHHALFLPRVELVHPKCLCGI